MSRKDCIWMCVIVGWISFTAGVCVVTLSTPEIRVDKVNEINGKLYKLVEVEPVYVEVEQ